MRLSVPKVIFVIGVNEDKFPASPAKPKIFNLYELENLREKGLEIGKSLEKSLNEELLVFYKSVTSCSEKLYISYSTSDFTGNRLYPSEQISEILEIFDIKLQDVNDLSPSFFSLTKNSTFYSYIQNFSSRNSEILAMERALREDDYYNEKLNYIWDRCKEQDFKLENVEIIKQLLGENLQLSASKFEVYVQCAFEFFCKYVLKIQKREQKELNPLFRGNFVHKCLHEILEKGAYDELQTKISQFSKEYLEKEYANSDFIDERFTSNLRIIEENILKIVKYLQKSLEESDYKPQKYELEIPTKSQKEPINITLQTGEKITLVGKIDRVDTSENSLNNEKYVRIVDYKSSQKEVSLENIYYGLGMQMFFYLFSITGKNADYSDYKPGGVLYMNTGIDEKFVERKKKDDMNLNADNFESIGFVLDEVDEKISKKSIIFTEHMFENLRKYSQEMLKNMGENLYNGKISANPLVLKDSNPCNFCDYKAVCGVDSEKKHQETDGEAKSKILEILEK
jgi:ATP-dependent helicase/nuclease subunit B